MDLDLNHQVVFARNWTQNDPNDQHDITFYGWISSETPRNVFEPLTNFLLFNLDQGVKANLVEIVEFLHRIELSKDALNHTDFGEKIKELGFSMESAKLNLEVTQPPGGRRSEINIIFSALVPVAREASESSQSSDDYDFDSMEWAKYNTERLSDFFDGF